MPDVSIEVSSGWSENAHASGFLLSRSVRIARYSFPTVYLIEYHWVNLDMPLSAGDNSARMRSSRRSAAGGMGEVWKARDTPPRRIIAIKVLPSGKLADTEQKRRFVQEAKAALGTESPEYRHHLRHWVRG